MYDKGSSCTTPRGALRTPEQAAPLVERTPPIVGRAFSLGPPFNSEGSSMTVVPTRLCHSIDEALQLLPIGRTTLFGLIQSGQLDTVNIGRRRLIPHAALVALATAGAVSNGHRKTA